MDITPLVASQIPGPSSSSMDISPLRSARGNSAHSPELRMQNEALWQESHTLRELLCQKEEQLWQTTQQAEHAIHQQNEQLRNVAQNYENHARDITSVEVAQSEVKVHRRMQGAMQQSQELKREQHRLRATRTEAQKALDSQRQEIIDHAENVLHQRTDAVATEARQALQAKQSQIDIIEERALHHIHSTEVRAQGEVMRKDLDLQRPAEDIFALQNKRPSPGSKLKQAIPA